MKSETRHVDGGGRDQQVEAKMLLPPKVKVFRIFRHSTFGCSLLNEIKFKLGIRFKSA